MKKAPKITWRLFLRLLVLHLVMLLSWLDSNAQYTILNNNKLRMGNGSENSVNTAGNLQQPFYFNSVQNVWRKLTYSVYPLDNAFAIGGDKTNEWNLNGTIVQNPALSNQSINTSQFVSAGGGNGYGTIVSKGTITIGASSMEIENTYTLPANSAYIEVKVKVKNVSSAAVENVRVWIGTRDDWVGGTDMPTKHKGNLLNGEFAQISNAATRAAALKIFTADEGVLFYTNSTRGNTIINGCCSWSNVINTNPVNSTTNVTHDGSYGFFVRFNDLAVNASDEFTWYYAAGELADLNEIINEVASVSGALGNIKGSSATFDASTSVASTGYWLTVPRNSAPPTAAQIKAGTNYGTVTVAAHGSSPMSANVEQRFNLTGLTASTGYDFYFVTEDATPQFSEIYSSTFVTHALPTISAVMDQSACQDVTTSAASFTIGDEETAAASLVLSAVSLNTTLVPDGNITITGSGASRTVTVTPAAGQFGTATIKLTVRDADHDEATTTFNATFTENTLQPPIVVDQSMYIYATAVSLAPYATGENLRWYSASSGGSGSDTAPTPVTTSAGTQQFFVSQTSGGCESQRATLGVTIAPTEVSGSSQPKSAYFPLASMVDEDITVTGAANIPNAKIFIASGFYAGDELMCSSMLPGDVTRSYNAATGELDFTGSMSAADWQTIFRSIRFRTTSTNPADRSIVVRLAGIDEHARTLVFNTDFNLVLSNAGIDEQLPAETLVGTFVVSGLGENLSLTYELVAGAGSTDNASFFIDGTELKTASVLDYESKDSYVIRVRITDNYAGSFEQTFTVSLNNLNDNKPVIAGITFSLDENALQGTPVGLISATDADGETVFADWTIVSGNTDNAFTVDPVTGELSVLTSSAIDFEQVQSFVLSLTVSDGELTSDPTTIQVQIGNVNDVKPVIAPGQIVYLDENSNAGTVAGAVDVSDADGVTDYVEWQITGGNVGEAFSIDAFGVLTVSGSTVIDYEDVATYTLVLSVKDGENTSEAETVVVHINNLNDTAPVIVASQSMSIDENSYAGTLAGSVLATDADGETTFGQWTIVDGNADNAFSIDAETGEITVSNSSAIDYEAIHGYTLAVSVHDGERTSAPVDVEILLNNLNDTRPVIATHGAFDIDENSAVGSVVTSLVATDADGPTVYGWSIVSGNVNDVFGINSSTGELTIAGVLDYEQVSSYELELIVNDGVNASERVEVIVNVGNLNDVKPVIAAVQSFAIDENTLAGSLAGGVNASDEDGSTPTGWTIIDGNIGGAFVIDPITGNITVANMAALDFESTKTFTLTLTVGDGTNTSEPVNVVIDLRNLNDTAPDVAKDQVFPVVENVGEGTVVGKVSIEDLDGETTYTFGISGGNGSNAFTIDPETGEIRIVNPESLDFERAGSYELTITVSDGENIVTQTVTVKISNENDNSPVDITLTEDQFTESVSEGFEIGSLVTTDADKEDAHTYLLVSGEGDTHNSRFAIEGDRLVTAGGFDYDVDKIMTVRVRSTDQGGRTYEKPFTLTVLVDEQTSLEVPTAFTPDGDQVNDVWEIDRLVSYPNASVNVLNSDGIEVFSNVGYSRRWDGTYKGKELAFGTYYYIIRLNDSARRVFKGTVMIIK